jgi:hypothetical protein
MSKPVTTFSADECQAILDLIDKAFSDDVDGMGSPTVAAMLDDSGTDEERAIYMKLQAAGAFYLPEDASAQMSNEYEVLPDGVHVNEAGREFIVERPNGPGTYPVNVRYKPDPRPIKEEFGLLCVHCGEEVFGGIPALRAHEEKCPSK